MKNKMPKKESRQRLQELINNLLKPVELVYHGAKSAAATAKQIMPSVYSQVESHLKPHIISVERGSINPADIGQLTSIVTSNIIKRVPSLDERELNDIFQDSKSKSFLDMITLGLGAVVGQDYTNIKKEKMFRSVLIANRGEIALRILRACKELEIEAHVIYSANEKNSLIVKFADKAHNIGDPKNYLNLKKIISIAKRAGVQAIHPGYGYLSENSEFSRRCKKNKITFIGPSPEAMEMMGNKAVARQTSVSLSIPVLEGTTKPFSSVDEAKGIAASLGYPVIMKAVAGGGGKGMRIVRNASEFEAAFKSAENEALAAFGKKDLYMERYLEEPRHIEFQILADSYGNVVHLGERDCSIQRRHQKLIEEAPSTYLDSVLREKLGKAAVKIAKSIKYEGAGTVEFLVDKNKNFYFMEMNTRIQVEHGVTEMITQVDLVKEQIKIAAGAMLTLSQESINLKGHAIECRINAEDPCNEFRPSTGSIINYLPPGGQGIRVSSHTHSGHIVSHHYDPLISNLICWGETRDEAIKRMIRALDEYIIEGIQTNIPFHKEVMKSRNFLLGRITTSFIEKERIMDKAVLKVCRPKLTAKAKQLIVTTAVAKYMAEKQKPASNNINPWVLAARQESLNQDV